MNSSTVLPAGASPTLAAIVPHGADLGATSAVVTTDTAWTALDVEVKVAAIRQVS
jgi:hypothetical protein